MASVLPHIVQNYATIGETDADARLWCKDFNAVYQPYAVARNARSFPSTLSVTLLEIAAEHQVSKQAVIYRYFLQLGTAIIPRSGEVLHLVQDLEALQWKLTDDEMARLNEFSSK